MKRRESEAAGVALIMVLLVLSALAMIGTPFVISMAIQDRASLQFAGSVAARQAAEAARNHALAHLERTSYPTEFEEEEKELDAERPASYSRSSGRATSSRSARRSAQARRGMIIRRDLGEKVPTREERDRRGRTRGRQGATRTDEARNGKSDIPEALRVSKKGPSAREHDDAAELAARPLPPVALPADLPAGTTRQETVTFRFDGPTGLAASATVEDEQGKIHLDTAPPNLIANLFGVSQLARPLSPKDSEILLDDASMFRGDNDPATLDGAVIIVDPENPGIVEAVTYRKKEDQALGDCFRGAFLSLIRDHVYPVGTFVQDLRGWKVGYHRFWAEREGGFAPRALTKLPAVESIRDIAGWQLASLFVTRFRGEGLTAEFLRQSGVNERELAKLGLDPAMFSGGDVDQDPALKTRFEAARKQLRKLGFSGDLVTKLKASRGARVVIDLAARLEGADRKLVDKTEADLAKSLAADRRRPPRIPEKYLEKALENLAEVYATPGIETIEPEDLEWLREHVTVSSHIASEWSESQAIADDVALGDDNANVRLPRAAEFNPGTVLRIRNGGPEGAIDLNEAGSSGKQMPVGGIRFAHPLGSSIKSYGATVERLERHPINVNTASRQVLRAVLTGVRGYDHDQTVTPYEADQLALRLMAARPLRGHDDLIKLLESAAASRSIDQADYLPLLINAIDPGSSQLRVATTGFCYASGDVYTVESRGALRSLAGNEIAAARFRELCELSPARRLTIGLQTQADMADGTYLQDPMTVPGFPEDRDRFLLRFPGTRSHLILTRPLLLHRTKLAIAGGDRGNARLWPGETFDGNQRYTLGELLHFRDTYEGLELASGEPFALNIDLAQAGANGQPAQAPPVGGTAGPGAGAPQDLTMVPGGVEFWFRMRTYPEARSDDGHLIIFDSGTERDRNRISLLYADQAGGRLLLRVYDSSLRDPSVERTRDNGQYLEVAATRPLELETWYHVRAVWSGVFGGGAQLFIDGLPAGTDNLSTELLAGIPASGKVAAIGVRDASKLPREGVVRIDQELFEYKKAGNGLQVRREPQSSWQPIVRQARGRRGQDRLPEPPPDPEREGGRRAEAVPREAEDDDGEAKVRIATLLPPLPAELAAAAPPAAAPVGQAAPPGPAGAGAQLATSDVMRAPWNKRGSTPSAHAPGAKVSLHGYSLEIQRKIRNPQSGAEYQIGDNDGKEIVWGQGGRRLVEPLNAFNFPTGTECIVHLQMPAGPEYDGQAEYIVPLFIADGATTGGLVDPIGLSATLRGGVPRNAIEYFQSKGVAVIGGGLAFFYKVEALPPAYIQLQARYRITPPQDKGLRVLARYSPQGVPNRQQPTPQGGEGRQGNRLIDPGPFPVVWYDLTQRSLLADGPIAGLYPVTGILEVRGAPSPAELGRPNFSGQPAFGKHPDDVVEWIRYAELFEGPVGGEQMNLFVGRTGNRFNFRGYPEWDNPAIAVDLRKQLDHPPGEPLRLVMELTEGGAGYGDYVTIATRDPKVYEPQLRRVYKVLEHEDGRFFVSLLDVAQNGQDIPSAPGIYKNRYLRSMYPRLVKFPTWGLPEIASGTMVLFGDAIEGASGGRSNVGGVRADEDEDPTGITIDEVRRLQDRTINRDPRYTVRFVVVPLTGSQVQFRGGGQGNASIDGRIAADRTFSRASPQEVLIVTLSREPGRPHLFAQGLDEGLLRIGDEVFYFEDPLGGPGRAQAAGTGTQAGTAQLGDPNAVQNPNQAQSQDADSRERDPLARTTITDQLAAQNISGHFEKEGFARIQDREPERRGFHEVFYYRQLSGGFSQCLRGQFSTPILQNTRGADIHNVTRRLRLVGRGLLGSTRAVHGLGDPVALVPYLTMAPVTGPMTPTGLPIKEATGFAPTGGYLLLDSGQLETPWEIVAHLGPGGEGLLRRPRDQKGLGVLRACFGTQERPLGNSYFAYEMPYRYPDRYQPETESESLAYLQKSFRVPGARWRGLSWLERPPRTVRDRKVDIVVALRFDGEPDWDAKPTNEAGGLYLLEEEDERSESPLKSFPLDRRADQVEVRVYFRYKSGAFQRLPGNRYLDDWKDTPILEKLTLEYEKEGRITRHEELPF